MEVTIVYNCNLCEFAPISLALNQNVLYEMAETTSNWLRKNLMLATCLPLHTLPRRP